MHLNEICKCWLIRVSASIVGQAPAACSRGCSTGGAPVARQLTASAKQRQETLHVMENLPLAFKASYLGINTADSSTTCSTYP